MRILLSCHARHNNMRHFPKHFTFLYFIFAIRGQKTERNEGKKWKENVEKNFWRNATIWAILYEWTCHLSILMWSNYFHIFCLSLKYLSFLCIYTRNNSSCALRHIEGLTYWSVYLLMYTHIWLSIIDIIFFFFFFSMQVLEIFTSWTYVLWATLTCNEKNKKKKNIKTMRNQ